MAPNNLEELKLLSLGYENIIGADEVGCGCLAAKCVTSCVQFSKEVIMNYRDYIPGVNDSKKLTSERREILSEKIKSCAQQYSFGEASVSEIDELNIFWAKFLAFRRAIENLKTKPDYILIDGDRKIPEISQDNQSCFVKGDGKIISIAAASILAKVERDNYVCELERQYPELLEYKISINKGYYSLDHIAALKKYGKTIWHREKYVRKFL